MATAITVTNSKESVKKIFNKISKAYFLTTPNTALSSLSKFDIELPLLSDGISFDTGKASVTEVKLTTGETWTSMSEGGEASIALQIPSIAGAINDLFLTKKGAEVTMTNTLEGASYKAQGYSLEVKKVNGGLFFLSEDRETAIYLPNAEIFASLVEDQSKGAYFDLSVKPVADNNGSAIYFLYKHATTGA